MHEIQKLIHNKKPVRLMDFVNFHQKINKMKQANSLPDFKIVNTAYLSSSTITGIKETLTVKCFQNNLLSDFYFSEYNQYTQDILNIDGALYHFRPDIIFLNIDTKTLLGEYFFTPYNLSSEKRLNFIHNCLNNLKDLLNTLINNTNSKIILHNFEIPAYSPMGILENKQNFGFIEAIKYLNSSLEKEYKDNTQVFIYDYDQFCSKNGKNNLYDPKMYYIGDLKIGLEYIPDLCNDYMSYIKALSGLTKKCIVLDLDNTLWGGIIGEDGVENIKLGPYPEGRSYWEFQKYLLALFNRGIILAINSKNNPEDVEQVFNQHPHMVLQKEHFASIKVNWEDKLTNIQAIARELNIGLNSIVFFDDDKLNRELIKSGAIEVHVVDMPEDPSLYPTVLQQVTDFNTFTLTSEDINKGKMYVQQRDREELRFSSSNINEFLQQLQMEASIKEANKLTIPRIAQLTMKTNQFNMTTRRYQQEQIEYFFQDNNYMVLTLSLKDKYGDNGITGTAIIKKDSDTWEIDTFLLSCRIIGRKAEEALLAIIIEKARQGKVKKLLAQFISTTKNAPARDFYKNNQFKLINMSNEIETWEFDLQNEYQFPACIKLGE